MENKDINKEEDIDKSKEVQNDAEAEDVISGAEAAAKEAETISEEAEKEKIEEISKDIVEHAKKQDEMIAQLNDKIKRQMAEFDNFRKRTDKEKTEMFDIGRAETIKKLLPIVDNFERGFKSIPEGEEKTQFAIGMEMVYKQWLKLFEEMEVTPIEALGKEFDPELHNAVQHIEKEDVGDNIIVEEYEKGYKYKDIVIRHSMVVVAN